MSDDFTSRELSPTSSGQPPNSPAICADFLAEYEKCILCKDHGKNCKGPKLSALRTISNVREYHRRLRNYRKISMKQIFALTEHEISNATVKDYFSHEEKDFRWTTVALIDNALTSICGECVGVPPVYLPNCPATSSEIREQIAAVAEKLRAAEEECLELQARIAENKGKHIEQLNEFRQDQQDRVEWMKADVQIWRRISFALLCVLALAIFAFIVYAAGNISR